MLIHLPCAFENGIHGICQNSRTLSRTISCLPELRLLFKIKRIWSKKRLNASRRRRHHHHHHHHCRFDCNCWKLSEVMNPWWNKLLRLPKPVWAWIVLVKLAEYRKQLFLYLTDKMSIVAPNLSALIGDTVAAHLVSKVHVFLPLTFTSCCCCCSCWSLSKMCVFG